MVESGFVKANVAQSLNPALPEKTLWFYAKKLNQQLTINNLTI